MKNVKALCFILLFSTGLLSSCIDNSEESQFMESSTQELMSKGTSSIKHEITKTWHAPTSHKKPLLSRDYHSKPTKQVGNHQKH